MRQLAIKVARGLREVAAEMGGWKGREIVKHAANLADAVGFVEASADLLAARGIMANAFHRYPSNWFRVSGITLTGAEAASGAALEGTLDDSDMIQDMLVAIERGRELAGKGHERQRLADSPDRLTITIAGPNGPNKATLVKAMCDTFPQAYRAPYTKIQIHLDPRIVEIQSDGRRFDVRNEVFLG